MEPKKRGRPKGSKNKPKDIGNDTKRRRVKSEDDNETVEITRAKGSDSSPSPAPQAGEWNPEKRAEFMDTIIANGYKATNLAELGAKLGLKKQQLVNQLAPGRKGSFREKAVKCVRGEK